MVGKAVEDSSLIADSYSLECYHGLDRGIMVPMLSVS